VEPRSVTVAHARRLSAHVEMSRPRGRGSEPRSAEHVVRFRENVPRLRAFRAGTATAARSALSASRLKFPSARRCVRARGGAMLAQAAPLMAQQSPCPGGLPVGARLFSLEGEAERKPAVQWESSLRKIFVVPEDFFACFFISLSRRPSISPYKFNRAN